MKLSKSYFFTLREDVKDEDSRSGNLLVRSGMIKKVGSGIYMFLPLGLRVLDKIRYIVKDEMDKAGAQELLMPSIIPREVYDTCGRTEAFGKDMFNLNDRYEKPYVLGPTHEELFTIAAKSMVQSYKDLHFTLFQMSNKFRDEEHPEYGLMRKKEFLMADAYSFDADMSGLDVSYDKMYQTFKNIFKKCNLDTIVVKSNPESMKGTTSEEFQVLCNFGDNEIVKCTTCSYSSNIEEASSLIKDKKDKSYDIKMLRKVYTPGVKTVKELKEYFNADDDKILKS